MPQAQFTHIKVPEGPADDRFVYLSDVLPTAWQAVTYAECPADGTLLVLGLGPIGDMACRIALHNDPGPQGHRRRPRAGAPRPRQGPRGRGHRPGRARRRPARGRAEHDRRPRRRRGDRRRRARRARLAERQALAQKMAGLLPDAVAQPIFKTAGRRQARGVLLRDRARPPRRHHLPQRRLRRHGRPAADDDAVRQADPAADGPGERQALGARHPPAADRRGPARASTRSRRTTSRSRRRRTRTRSSRTRKTAASRSCSTREPRRPHRGDAAHPAAGPGRRADRARRVPGQGQRAGRGRGEGARATRCPGGRTWPAARSSATRCTRCW